MSHVPWLGWHVMVIWVAQPEAQPKLFKLEPPSSTPMVSTRQAGRTRKSAEKSSPPADSGDEYEERTPEPNKTRGTKRVRTAKTTAKGKQQEKRRKKAKLSMLPEMPIDILYEVCGLPCIVFLLMRQRSRYFPSSTRRT